MIYHHILSVFILAVSVSSQLLSHPPPGPCLGHTIYFNKRHCPNRDQLQPLIISDDGKTILRATAADPFEICITKEIFSGNAYLIGPGMDQNGKGVAKIGFSFGRDHSRAAYLQKEGDTIGHAGTGQILASPADFESGSFGGMPYGQALLSWRRNADYVITTTDKKAWLDLAWCPQPQADASGEEHN